MMWPLAFCALAWSRPLPQMDCPDRCPAAQTRGAPLSHVRLLLGLVVSWTWTSRMMVVENMLALDTHDFITQSWLLAVYDSNDNDYVSNLWKYERRLARLLNVSFQVYAAEPKGLTCPFCPKLQFQLKFAEAASAVDYVWLPDVDMSFRDFDARGFWQAHGAAGHPLIAQPTITPSTQEVQFCVNHDQWSHCRPAPPERSYVRITYVEQQAPVFEARFFKWVMPRFADLAQLQQRTGGSWGHCNVWCGAALAYNSFVHEPDRVACALILHDLYHRDTHAINKTHRFFDASQKLKDDLARLHLFPDDHPVTHFVRYQARLLRDKRLYDVQNTNLWVHVGDDPNLNL